MIDLSFVLSSTLSFIHCLATHLSASDSFSTMALYRSIYFLTYLVTILIFSVLLYDVMFIRSHGVP